VDCNKFKKAMHLAALVHTSGAHCRLWQLWLECVAFMQCTRTLNSVPHLHFSQCLLHVLVTLPQCQLFV
jgi:hypothetical protein